MLRKQELKVYGLFPPYTVKTFQVWQVEREHSYEGEHYEGWHLAHSVALICPICQTKWAVLAFKDEVPIWPRAQTCETCSYEDEWMPVPGSILLEEGYGAIDTALLDALPDTLVRREFELHLKAYSNDRDKSKAEAQAPVSPPMRADQRDEGSVRYPSGSGDSSDQPMGEADAAPNAAGV